GNYNRPKVICSVVGQSAVSSGIVAPRIGNGAVCIWLYAGKPEYPALLAGLAGSDNATGAENQQERLVERRESSETIRQISSSLDDEMVPSAWRHAGNRIKGNAIPFG